MTTPPLTPPTVLTARSSEDLLAAAPVVLGFWPTDSLVMLTFGCRRPFHARVDLPARLADLPEVVQTLVEPAHRHRADRVVLLVYSDDPRVGDASWQALRDGFAEVGIDIVDAVRVGATRWFPLRGHDRRTRLDGVAYDVSAHPFLVQAVADGRVTHGSRDELARTLEPDPAGIGRVQALLERTTPVADVLGEGRWLEALVAGRLVADDPAEVSDADVARLLGALDEPELLGAVFAPMTRGRARAAVGFWTAVLRRSPPASSALPAAVLAWSAWQHGDGALAWCAVDRCRAVDPEDGLAGLVAEALEHAVPPDAPDEPRTWTPIGWPPRDDSEASEAS